MNHSSRSEWNFFLNGPHRIRIFWLTCLRDAFYSDLAFIMIICVLRVGSIQKSFQHINTQIFKYKPLNCVRRWCGTSVRPDSAFSYFLHKMAHYLHHHLVTLDVPASQTCPICLSVCADRDQLPTFVRLGDFHSVRFMKLQREKGREREKHFIGRWFDHTHVHKSKRQTA